MITAFVFPGQGSQKVGMMRDLYEAHASVRERFATADEALGFSLSTLIFEGPAEELVKTEFTQPAILTASVAAYDLLAAAGCRADFMAGHSLGEYSALVAADAMGFADAVRAVHLRGRFMQEAVPLGEGGMAAVIRLDREQIVAICEEVSATYGPVQAVNFNCPGQVVIAGRAKAVEAAGERMKEAGAGRVVPLAVSAPFHSTLMQPAAERLRDVLDEIEIRPPKTTVIANVHARPVTTAQEVRDALVEQAAHPVLWEDSMRYMLAQGLTRQVEIGPGSVLTGFMRKIDRHIEMQHVEDAAGLESTLAAWKGATE